MEDEVVLETAREGAMIGRQLFLGLAELETEISRGGCFLVAGAEELLRQIPKGNWIAGTIPRFETKTGAELTRGKVHVSRLPSCVGQVEIKTYDEASVANVYADAPDNGFSLMIVPASSKTHRSFAINAPKYNEFATSPLAGWVSGASLDDPAKPTPKVFDGRFGKEMDNAAVVMHALLPKGKTAVVGIVNVFEPSDDDILTFAEDGFEAAEVMVNGKKEDFPEYLRRKNLDTRLPLVTDNGGALMNVSFAKTAVSQGKVRFYAPVFKNVQYRPAKPCVEYGSAFAKQKPADIDERIIFSCNCFLNRNNYDLEDKSQSRFPGPDTFGEIAYQLLNQTSVYVEIATANLAERLRDETAVRRLNRELREQRDEILRSKREAEIANRAKSEFLANMSHEIRTPMTAILGFAEVLQETATGPEQLEAARTIQRNGEYLLQIINDILDISKIEAGKMQVESVPCSPCTVFSEVAALMRVRAKAKDLPLELVYVGPMPQTIRTDPTRLRQILINLIGNAVKFTEVGRVQIIVRIEGADSESPKLRVEVIDTGVGMSREQMAGLFQAFCQADASMTRRFGGTGLGLTISKRLAQTLGGDISVTSRLGEGTACSLLIETGPLANVGWIDAPVAAEKEPRANRDRKVCCTRLDGRILLAEDGIDNQRLITFLLKKAGAEVTLAENGLIAYDLALEAHHSGTPFDVILMDMQMPIMDGYEATRRLRVAGYTGPILALTAHAMNTDQQRCLDAGCDDYLTKPIDRERLMSRICMAMGKAADSVG